VFNPDILYCRSTWGLTQIFLFADMTWCVTLIFLISGMT
jgi:hypothetical protein